MNLFNILDEIETVDPEINERLSPRRDAIKNITSFGSKVAVAALPFALGTMFKKAYGQAASPAVIEVLNFALTLEFLEAEFYNTGKSSGVIPASDKPYLNVVARDENAHVKFLQDTIAALGGTAVSKPNIDLSGGNGSGNGPFKNAFNDYALFLTAAQVFEDTGVRAYKGQAPALKGNQVVLTAALSIHAVEARHASAIRKLRFDKGMTDNKPWIESTLDNGNDTKVSLANGNYAGEENITQGGVNLSGLASTRILTASFDEPLSKQAVLDLLVGSFIVA
ncbi:ferritin-like domain-containing protein [Mucilaginibacter terrigena]|uniref:Ferritin-like domain-containing protein n=1 Tax=Mucilaginibacter terrigena TaxID=2492395 RepID=A0A4Q5LJA9_9SPHI|nr:ferritin-like domain-containing protein [Mucilaginibacter terrigena]RYU86965.1 ferritin-like domain-containing protein [Mucilaginibacter terrigena]